MQTESSNANRQIARAAGTVMLAIILSQVTGLVRGVLVAGAFGASPELDAFLAANRVSETLFLLVAGGALSSAFLPAFAGLLAKDQPAGAWRLASGIANALVITLTALAAIASAFAPHIVRYLLAPGFSDDAVLFGLTVSLLRIQLISAVLFGLGGLIVGILNAHQVFWIPALTPALYQLGIIFGALYLAPTFGIYGLAWGVVLGALLYLVVQLPSLSKRMGTYTPGIGFADPMVRAVMRLMGPRLVGVGIVQLNFWVNTWLASQMSSGSVTALYYGFSLMLMAQAAIAQSVAIAAMPTFSAQHALAQFDEMRFSLAAALRGVILLAMPASVGLILLRAPLVSLLYERGEFDARSVELVSWALLWYAVGLVGHAIMEVLTRAFYAQQDTRTPVLIGSAAMLLNVGFSVIFAALFLRAGWLPLGGLALANSLATALEATALFFVMRRRLGGIHADRIALALGAATAASLTMAIGLLAWQRWTGGISPWFAVLGAVLLGGLLYAAAAWALRVPEIGSVQRLLRTRLGRR